MTMIHAGSGYRLHTPGYPEMVARPLKGGRDLWELRKWETKLAPHPVHYEPAEVAQRFETWAKVITPTYRGDSQLWGLLSTTANQCLEGILEYRRLNQFLKAPIGECGWAEAAPWNQGSTRRFDHVSDLLGILALRIFLDDKSLSVLIGEVHHRGGEDMAVKLGANVLDYDKRSQYVRRWWGSLQELLITESPDGYPKFWVMGRATAENTLAQFSSGKG